MFDTKIFAANVKKYRTERNMRQYELAEKLGVTAQSVSKWEQALAVPDLSHLWVLAKVLGISTDKLLGLKEGRSFIAIDGGGSKTEFLCFNEKGHLLGRRVLEGCNPNICGIERTKSIITEGIRELLGGEDPEAVFLGMAGILSGHNSAIITEFLRESYPHTKTDCGSDILNVAASGTDDETCIAVICGTGSNVSALKGRQIHRVGGWGYLFDGAGSGFDIGRDGITAALSHNDGMGDETLITTLIEKKLGGNIWDNIGRIYAEDKSFIASCSREVFTAKRQGDKTAACIIERNASVLAERINFASEKYNIPGTVVLSGGIVSNNGDFREMLLSKLKPELHPVVPTMPPIYGACILCAKLAGIAPSALKENFESDYERLCKNAEN